MSAPQTAGSTIAPPSARIERLPGTSREHLVWTAVLSLMFLCDIADVYAFAYVAPQLRSQWGLSITDVGALTSFTFLGMFVGALTGGHLADRIGRKRTLTTAAIAYATCSILCALAPTYGVLAVLRFLTGVGVQAATSALLVYIVEMFPRTSRGRYMSLMIGIGSLGIPLMAIAARQIVPTSADAWRWVFVIGGIGLLPAVLVAWLLPESVRWLELNGRTEQAEQVADRLEKAAEARTGQPLPAADVHPAEPHYTVKHLARPPYRKRTVVICLTMFLGIFGAYGFTNWVPTMLVEKGYSSQKSLTITAILAIAPVVGALAAAPMADRWQRRRVMLVLSALVAAAMVIFAFTTSVPVLVAAGFITAFLIQTNAAVMYAYLPEIFPTSVRGAGSGLANGFGRLAGVASGLAIAAIAEVLGFTGVFVTTAIVILAGGLIICFFGENTHNRALLDITDAAAEPAGPSRAGQAPRPSGLLPARRRLRRVRKVV
ncbi:MFS transporter [Streptomyces althioticus]|uniref:MFS transporter n=1 Tax=Streptomyces althioticus TaxID=83380 RepID=UPI0036963526